MSAFDTVRCERHRHNDISFLSLAEMGTDGDNPPSLTLLYRER